MRVVPTCSWRPAAYTVNLLSPFTILGDRLLLPQNRHGVDDGGLAGRQVAGEDCDQRQQYGNCRECERVERFDFEQQAGKKTGNAEVEP
jgi:hypothetical protein